MDQLLSNCVLPTVKIVTVVNISFQLNVCGVQGPKPGSISCRFAMSFITLWIHGGEFSLGKYAHSPGGWKNVALLQVKLFRVNSSVSTTGGCRQLRVCILYGPLSSPYSIYLLTAGSGFPMPPPPHTVLNPQSSSHR